MNQSPLRKGGCFLICSQPFWFPERLLAWWRTRLAQKAAMHFKATTSIS